MTSDVSLLVTAGRGPVECHRAVAATVAAIGREADERDLGFATTAESGVPSASAVVRLSGEGASALASSWTGTVAMVDPSSRGRGGRRNFYVAVHRMPGTPPPIEIREEDVAFTTMRAGGPGGQHQNVTDSAVRAVHRPTGLATLCRDGRSQHQNKKLALERLAGLASSQAALREAIADREGWVSRITVERGNAIRQVDRLD